MLGELLFRFGQTLGALETRTAGAGDASHAGRAPREGHPGSGARDLPDDRAVAVGAALSAGAAWLAGRLLRPRPVRWTRVVLAGAGGALLAEVVGRLQREDDGGPLPHADDPAELLGRLAAGIAVAAGYASILYPRLPGSPLFRGLAFGALEIAAAPRGGLVRIAAETPGLRFPLQALALPVDEDASPLAHMAFGLALGVLYRNGSRAVDPDGDEDQDQDESDEALD